MYFCYIIVFHHAPIPLLPACNRTRTPRAYMVTAGLEHEKFTNLFPYWSVNPSVQELNNKVPTYYKVLNVYSKYLCAYKQQLQLVAIHCIPS